MKKKLVLAIGFVLLSSFSLFLKTNAYATDEAETRTERNFKDTAEFCYFLFESRVANGFMTEEERSGKCQVWAESPSFFFDNGEIRVPDDEIWVLNNVNMELGYVGSRFVIEKGKLIIDGEDTLIRKYDGCFIVVTPEITKDNLEIRAGTFDSGNGTAAPICYETIGGPDGNPTRESLGNAEDALNLLMSYIPEDSIYLDLSDEPNKELKEVIPTTKWMHKMDPSWFYVFNSWKFKVVKRPENPEPEPTPSPENPEPEPTPTNEPEPEPTPTPTKTETNPKPAQKSVSNAPKTPDTSLIPNQTSLASESTSEKSSDSARISYEIPIIMISVVIYTILFSLSNRGKRRKN